ncbi:MAG: hypothetical protein [Caudoviricetes sp.]|nr:MAG: hypothetical protein [Caudoviricetes sp.]
MAITIDQAMDHLNADDDEREKVELALKHAQSMVKMEVLGNDKDFKAKYGDFDDLRSDMLDRVTLQVLANNYLHAAGDAKQNSTSSSSEDSMLSYTRVPSV